MATPVSNSVPLLTGRNNNNGTLKDEFISGLAQGSSWDFGGGPRVLTYSLDLNFDGRTQNWPRRWITAIEDAFDAWEAVADIEFARVGTPNALAAKDSSADMGVALMPGDGQGVVLGLGFFPDPAVADQVLADLGYSRDSGEFRYPRPEGDVFFDSENGAFRGLRVGAGAFEVLLHEIGHALGLKHTDDDGANGRPTFRELGIRSYDSPGHTVMGSEYAGGAATATPGPLDILAIQHIYGANLSYRTGNDIYALDNSFRTIWDAGGDDELSAVSWKKSGGLHIDLREGEFSGRINARRVAIAYDVVIENAVGGNFSDLILGNDAVNRLRGNKGRDTLNGGAGVDTLIGGADGDTYIVDSALDVVIESAGGSGLNGDLLRASVSLALPMNVEHLLLEGSRDIDGTGNDAANKLTGNRGANILTGGDGADRLDGGAGIDTLEGGAGRDAYFVDDRNDVIVENAGEGTDTVYARASATLAENVEILRLLGSADISGTGGSGSDTIWGNVGENLLRGGGGDDRLFGDDPFLGFRGADDTIRGGAGADTISGHVGDDWLYGDAGDDSIDGGFGRDSLDGGDGNDTLRGAAGSYFAGGTGDDLYFVMGRGSFVVELADGSTDTVHSSVSRALEANVEHLFLEENEFAVFAHGNDLNNIISGNFYSNRLTGGAGDDTMYGGHWNDTMEGGDGNDLMYGDGPNRFIDHDLMNGGAGSDTLYGGYDNDRLSGGDGDDVLDGGFDADTLNGGAGSDTMTGGQGGDHIDTGSSPAADFIVFTSQFDGTIFGDLSTSDRVAGFVSGEDRIALADALADALDDGPDNGLLSFIENGAADLGTSDEALLLTSAFSGLVDADLLEFRFNNVRAEINGLGITAAIGGDGLIVVQGNSNTGVFVYAEDSGNGMVDGIELHLLAIFNGNLLEAADFVVANSVT